jgi:hypothetical protein
MGLHLEVSSESLFQVEMISNFLFVFSFVLFVRFDFLVFYLGTLHLYICVLKEGGFKDRQAK